MAEACYYCNLILLITDNQILQRPRGWQHWTFLMPFLLFSPQGRLHKVFSLQFSIEAHACIHVMNRFKIPHHHILLLCKLHFLFLKQAAFVNALFFLRMFHPSLFTLIFCCELISLLDLTRGLFLFSPPFI